MWSVAIRCSLCLAPAIERESEHMFHRIYPFLKKVNHHLFNTHGIAAGCAKWWQIEDLLVRGARSGWPGASARRKAAPATSTSGGKSPRVGGAPHYKLYEERGLRALARNTGEREEARQRGRIAFDLNQTLDHCIVGCDLPREQP